MSYELRLNTFSGPLEKLLELIQEQELDITTISLAAVTDDFVRYVEKLEHAPPALLADFISVASQLLLLKSKALLPDLRLTPEEEEEIMGLEERLRIYQELRQAFRLIKDNWQKGTSFHGRTYLPMVQLGRREADTIYPGEALTLERIEEAVRSTLTFLQRVVGETEIVREKIVRLEDKMQEIVSRMRQLEKANLRTLTQNGSRGEVILIFLALLHLAREQTIELEQGERFSDIMVKTRGSEEKTNSIDS